MRLSDPDGSNRRYATYILEFLSHIQKPLYVDSTNQVLHIVIQFSSPIQCSLDKISSIANLCGRSPEWFSKLTILFSSSQHGEQKKPLSLITLPQCLLLLLRILLLLLLLQLPLPQLLFLLLLLLLTPNILYVGVDTPLTQSLFTYLSLALVYSSILLYRGQKLRVYVISRSLHFETLLFG